MDEMSREPAIDCPRRRLLQRGPRALEDEELLALLLRDRQSQDAARQHARSLLAAYGDLSALFSCDASLLQRQPGVGPSRAGRLVAARELARRAVEAPLRVGSVLGSPTHTRQFLQQHLAPRQREVFCCLFLDAQHRLQCCEDLFLGTLDSAAVYPREVVAASLRHRAAAVILAHNHPSGVATPSAADRQITERLASVLGLIDVRVLDHVIVGRGAYFSFAEAGLL